MTQPEFTVRVHLDADSFRRFYLFDTLTRGRGWVRPVVFCLVMCALATLCFLFQSLQRGALLLGVVLLIVGIGLPLAFFVNIFRFISGQSRKLRLDTPKEAAVVSFSSEGFVVRGGKEPLEYGWEQVYQAFRVSDAVYLYVAETQAFLLPDADAGGPDKVWDLLCAHVAPDKLSDLRKS